MATPVVTPIHPEDEAALLGKKSVLDELAVLKGTRYSLTTKDFYGYLFTRFRRHDGVFGTHRLIP